MAKSKTDNPSFCKSMIKVATVTTLSEIRSDNLVHTKHGVWINDKMRKGLTLYSDNFELVKNVSLQFPLFDIASTAGDDIVATEFTNKRVIRVSSSGTTTALRQTGQLEPWGICVNNKQQIVVGLRKGHGQPPIKMVVYSTDGSMILQEIEKDKSGKPLFTKSIYQVKQNINGDYIAADTNIIVCVTEEGVYKWEYKVQKEGEIPPYVAGIVCDKYGNIIIAEFNNDKLSLLDGEGALVTTLMTRDDGVYDPWSLTIDGEGLLWIGQLGNVKVVTYI